MNFTVREAATHLGLSPRAVRAAIKAGRIPAFKRGGQWIIPRRNLPLTEAQRAAAAGTIEDLHHAVDEAVPQHIRRQLGHGLSNLRAFEAARAVFEGLPQSPDVRAAGDALREGMRALAEGHHQYDVAVKIEALTRARGQFSRAAADLLVLHDVVPAAVRLAAVIEADVLPPIGGLLRRAESLPARAAS